VTLGRPGGGGPPAAPPTPTPTATPTATAPVAPNPTRLPLGKGPATIVAFTVEATDRTSLLDPATGRYVQVPYRAVAVSPDGRRVAVHDGRRTGLTDRALTRVHWLDLIGDAPQWSPDGKALLVTRLDRPGGYLVQRYDLATDSVSTTRLDGVELAGATMWAADSRDYLILRPDGVQLLRPDGSLGLYVRAASTGGVVRFNPSRTLATIDLTGDDPVTAVWDVGTEHQTAVLQPYTDPWPKDVGWKDDTTVVRLDRDRLILVDARTGRPTTVVPLPGVPVLSWIQVGPGGGKAGGF
jgi:hypothetical protein